MARTAFLLSTLHRLAAGQPQSCPYCSSANTVLLQRKKVLLELRRCQDCFLMYRYPKDNARTNLAYYQTHYRQGMTTEVPTPAELARLLATNFRGTEKDLSQNVRIVQEQCAMGRLLDYGCSWGYGVYQFCRSGYEAIGFEISKPRADYGRRHLQVTILDDVAALEKLPPASFDVIHSSHVLEHLPEPRQSLMTFERLLNPSGVLVIFVPNAGSKNARKLGVRWGPMICEKHCLALDAEFLAQVLPEFGFRPKFASSPYTAPFGEFSFLNADGELLGGDELAVVAVR